jgi:hypothetical protein
MKIRATWPLLGAVAVSSCFVVHEPRTAVRPRAGGQVELFPPEACPAAVARVAVWTIDRPGAVAIAFSTDGDVHELQRRVERMAELHNQRVQDSLQQLSEEASRRAIERELPPGVDSADFFTASGPGGPEVVGLDSEGPDLGVEMEPRRRPRSLEVELPSDAIAVPTLDGAELVLTPHRAENLVALRELVGRRADAYAWGSCPTLA